MKENDDIYTLAENIMNGNDFIEFLRLLNIDCDENFEEWGNQTLKAYLDGLYGFAMSFNDKEKNFGLPNYAVKNSLRIFAEMLLAATVYE